MSSPFDPRRGDGRVTKDDDGPVPTAGPVRWEELSSAASRGRRERGNANPFDSESPSLSDD